jgi:hypothetical protein
MVTIRTNPGAMGGTADQPAAQQITRATIQTLGGIDRRFGMR